MCVLFYFLLYMLLFIFILNILIFVPNTGTIKLLIEAPDTRLVLETRLILEIRLPLKHCQTATVNHFFFYVLH